MGYVSLYQVIKDRIILNDLQFNGLRNFLASGLRAQHKKQKLAYMTPVSLLQKENHEIYRRLLIGFNGEVQYVAGQDYVSELRKLRDLLLS
mgnify:FL=1